MDQIGLINRIVDSAADIDMGRKWLDTEAYRVADLTHPHSSKYHFKDMPKDSFHIACIAHRRENLATAQAVYLEKQKGTVAHPSEQTTT